MMLIARAPMRLSFCGGGTDLPAYYEHHGALVVSTSIRYGFHAMLSTAPSDGVQILSADHRALCNPPTRDNVNQDEDLHLPRAVVDFFQPRDGLVIFLASEIPSGCGLGTCGAMTVSMIKALSFWCGVDLEPAAAAHIACQIQIDRLDVSLGREDLYAAAFGGTNRIKFSPDGVVVEPLRMRPGTEDALQERLMLFFTGVSQPSSDIRRRLRQEVLDRNDRVLGRLGTIKTLAAEMGTVLEEGDLRALGELLHRSWMEKRELVRGVTSAFIDQCYEAARSQGATGGKICGAGGGGFLLLCCPKRHQDRVTEAMEALGLRRWPLALDRRGVQLMQARPWHRLSSDTVRWETTPRPQAKAPGVL